MKPLALALLALTANAQDLRISASTLTPDAVHALFGPLRKQYGAARVDICSSSPAAATVPLAKIRQQLKLTNNINVLSTIEAMQVIAMAQASTKKAKVLRYGVAAVEIAAFTAGLSGIGLAWKTGLNDGAIFGAQSLSIFSVASTPAALITYTTVALPETLTFLPNGCIPQAIQLTDSTAAQRVDFTFPIPGAGGSVSVSKDSIGNTVITVPSGKTP